MPRKGSRRTTARSKRSRRSKRKSAAKTSPKRTRTRFRNAPGEIDNVYTPGEVDNVAKDEKKEEEKKEPFLYPVAQIAQEYVKSQAYYMRQLFNVLTELGKNNENPNDESIFNVEAMKRSVKKMILIEQKFERIFRDMISKGGVMGVYDSEKETTFLDLLMEIHKHAAESFDSMPHEYWIYSVGNKRIKLTAINSIPSQRFLRVKDLIEAIVKKMTLDEEYEDREARGWTKEHTKIIIELRKVYERMRSKARLINTMITMAELCKCEGNTYLSKDSLCHLVTRPTIPDPEDPEEAVEEDIRDKVVDIRSKFFQ